MEDFHVKHLTDQQMKELNPIIRNALCTFFHCLDNQDNKTVQATLRYYSACIPDYWEEPQLLQDYTDAIRRKIGESSIPIP